MVRLRRDGTPIPKLKYKIPKKRKKVLYPCIHCGKTHKSVNGATYCKLNPEADANRAKVAEKSREQYYAGNSEALKAGQVEHRDKISRSSRRTIKRLYARKTPNFFNTRPKGPASPLYGRQPPPHVTLAREMGKLRALASRQVLDKFIKKHDVITPFMPTAFDPRFFNAGRPLRDEFEIGEIADQIFSGDFDGF